MHCFEHARAGTPLRPPALPPAFGLSALSFRAEGAQRVKSKSLIPLLCHGKGMRDLRYALRAPVEMTGKTIFLVARSDIKQTLQEVLAC